MKRTHTILVLTLVILIPSCAPYAANTLGIRQSLSSGDHTGAMEAVRKAAHGPSKLLFFLESGLIAHYEGNFTRSNILLDQAERTADQIFTKSITRELASLITSDETRDYRGETYELVFIHYYRALNYWYLGMAEDALVECRKANLKLDLITRKEETEQTYRNDAFIHYLTALFYEAEDEYNDAYVSLKDAQTGYQVFQEHFGLRAPEHLVSDLARIEAELGYASLDAPPPTFDDAGKGELVIFTELGFIPRKTQEEIDVPIYDSDLKRVRTGKSGRVARQVRHRHYRGRHAKVDYWLRVALPRLEPATGGHERIRILASGTSVEPTPAHDLESVARKTLTDNEGTILMRTVARGLVKLAATKAAKKESEWLGFLVNLFTAATEKADTRSWVTLPREIRIGRMILPPGRHTITIESFDRLGRTKSEITRTVEIKAGKRTFINQRLYS